MDNDGDIEIADAIGITPRFNILPRIGMLGKRKNYTYSKKYKQPRKKITKYSPPTFYGGKALGPQGLGRPSVKVIQTTNFAINIAAGATTNTYSTLGFTLGNLAQVASWQALYDEYRIVKARVTFLPLQNNSVSTAPGLTVWTIKDWNDATTPTTEAEFLNNDTLKVTAAYERHVRSLTPALCSVDAAGKPIVMNQSNWVPCSNKDAVYYGVKYMIRNNGATGAAFNALCMEEVHYEFRNVQ